MNPTISQTVSANSGVLRQKKKPRPTPILVESDSESESHPKQQKLDTFGWKVLTDAKKLEKSKRDSKRLQEERDVIKKYKERKALEKVERVQELAQSRQQKCRQLKRDKLGKPAKKVSAKLVH